MNVLVVCNQLLSKIYDVNSADFVLTAHEIYLSTKFDAILLLTDDTPAKTELFNFSKAFTKKLLLSDDINILTLNILNALECFSQDVRETCDFILICDKEDIMENLAKSSKHRQCVCFMQVEDDYTPHNFTKIAMSSDDSENYGLFASNAKKYDTAHSNGNVTLLRKINKLKRVKVHCIWKPATDSFSDEVRI